MDAQPTSVELAEQVADIARCLDIETALIGAYALAAYHYVRGTIDIDLATAIELDDLMRFEQELVAAGFETRLFKPDEQDPLGGKLLVWQRTDADGDPIDPVEVVNFCHPYRVLRTPARAAIENAVPLQGKPSLRYPRLPDLIALKLYAGGLRDQADVVELLVRNPSADLDEIRSVCRDYELGKIDELIATAQADERWPQ